MKLGIISFTENGRRLSEHIAKALHEQEQTGDALYAEISSGEMPVGEWAKIQMKEKNALLFIGACGIAVRAVAPYLTDKLHDSPVLVMDERGKYVIPILAGHVGGANEIARYLGEITGAEPVITTATDINHKFAVDLFAKENDLCIINKEGIAKVSSKVLAGEEITVSVEPGYESGLKWESSLDGIRQISYPPKEYADIVITTKPDEFDAALILQPKEYVIGLGCKKGKSAEEIDFFLMGKLSECGVSISQVLALASISVKNDEQGIIRWCRKENIPFLTYTAKELHAVEGDFVQSSFVQEQVGVDNVCERAAIRACGGNGQLICAKCAENGMTFALAKRRRGRNLS